MRRVALTLLVVVAGVAAVLFATGARGDDDAYLVRAIFDNGSFIVEGEDVRVAGANIGVVEEVDVSMPGERVSNVPGEEEQPGKAVVVMRITDPAFQDFRQDASCILRPQSLIGERYINCRLTEPTADGEPKAPPLERIPEGEPGAGQYLLPLENNGKIVDVDLINNIMRQPYAERFRLILSELGAGFAARGDELREVVERANPTLREVNRLIASLERQRHKLSRLARDSAEILKPLARERRHLTGFIQGAERAAAATAERREELEEALAKFPGFLEELESTMAELGGFAEAATPVARDFGSVAPELTRATKALEPFARGSTAALRSLGEAAEGAGPKLVDSLPIVKTTGRLARTGERPTRDLKRFLGTTKLSGGFEYLMRLIYGYGGSINLFDDEGHLMRTALVASNCLDYDPEGLDLNCTASFSHLGRPPKLPRAVARVGEAVARAAREIATDRATADVQDEDTQGEEALDETEPVPAPGEGEEPAPEPEQPQDDAEAPPAAGRTESGDLAAARALLDFLMGP